MPDWLAVMADRDKPDWLGWMSPLFPVWLWHALFDGTRLCRCHHSAEYRQCAEDRRG